jgi:hypothetical protein
VCVHVRSTASLHISFCNYWKLLNSGLNTVDTRRRQLKDTSNFGVLANKVYFAVFSICKSLWFILVLYFHLLLNLHSKPFQFLPPKTQLYWLMSPSIFTFTFHPIPIDFFPTHNFWHWFQILKLLIMKACPNYVTASWVEQHFSTPYLLMSTIYTPSSLTDTKFFSNIKWKANLRYFRF